jgi:fibronectin-binding autotransporter adhesin
MYSFHDTKQKGNVLIIVMLLFVVISLSIASGLVVPVLRANRIARSELKSKQSYFLAESGIEDAYYRIKNSKQISASETLILDGQTATTTITTVGTSQKTIVAQGDVDNVQRKITAVLATGEGIAFNYGLQAGNGGMTIGGNSTIDGNIYSNGTVSAISATVTGSVIAADSAALTADQTNDSPATPVNSINFRNASASQDFAQSFQLSTGSPINKVQFYIKKVGSPADATVRLVADNGGSPSTSTISIGTVSLSSALVTTNYGWIEVVFPTTVSLVPGETYWIVLDNSSNNASSYYTIAANNTYTDGAAKTGTYGSTWSTTSLDGYFKIYTGGIASTIGGATYASGVLIGSSGVGDAWATTVKGATVAGNLYCTTGTNNNKSCNTTHGTPSSQAMPYSEANFAEWKEEAEAGGTTTGDVTVGSAGASIGPKKITGNLTVGGGGTLTLTGTVYVQGNITLTAGGKLRLPAAYGLNSGKLISDGIVSISGGGSIGSGTPGSYIFITTTSQCPNDVGCSGASAISVNGGAGAIAVNAQYGNVALSGGATINAVVGNSITVTGGSTITYDQGLASPSFVSGPSGAWTLSSWQETQ